MQELAHAEGEEGTGLLVALIMVSLLVTVGGAVALSTTFQSNYSLEAEYRSAALVVADNGLAKGKAMLLADLAAGTDAFVSLTPSNTTLVHTFTEDDATVEVYHVSTSGSRLTFRMLSAGSFSNATRSVEVVISGTRNSSPSQGPALAAVLAQGDIDVTGNILINGNDHDPDGTSGGAGVDVDGVKLFGGSLAWTGNPDVGGNGTAPNRLDAGDENQTFTNNDSTFDPEGPSPGLGDDGIDNDLDGWADENGFPQYAGEFVKQDDDIGLRTRAQNQGTYFTNKSDYDSWMSSATPAERGGKVIMIEIPPPAPGDPDVSLGQFDLPHNPPPAEPSIVVVQYQPADPGDPPQRGIEVGPIHVKNEGTRQFQGLFMTDVIKNTNGNGSIVGAVVSFGGANKPHFGNGGADILFSSEVLANLPGVDSTGGYVQDAETWREVR